MESLVVQVYTITGFELTEFEYLKNVVTPKKGAGKTSIIEALFRMEEYDGEIIIDGIRTTTLGLHDLRKNISYIPQNPILFSGSLRFNLDPFCEVSEAEIWNAVDQVTSPKTSTPTFSPPDVAKSHYVERLVFKRHQS